MSTVGEEPGPARQNASIPGSLSRLTEWDATQRHRLSSGETHDLPSEPHTRPAR